MQTEKVQEPGSVDDHPEHEIYEGLNTRPRLTWGDEAKIAARRLRVAELWHQYHNIADVTRCWNRESGETVSDKTISRDLKIIREQWQDERNQEVGKWQAQELAYAIEARAYARELFRNNEKHPITYGRLEGEWTNRIANLLGLDAPKKIDNSTTDKSWREMLKEYAEKEGISEEEAKRLLLNEVNEIANERLSAGEGSVPETDLAGEGSVEPVELETNSPQGWEIISPTDSV